MKLDSNSGWFDVSPLPGQALSEQCRHPLGSGGTVRLVFVVKPWQGALNASWLRNRIQVLADSPARYAKGVHAGGRADEAGEGG